MKKIVNILISLLLVVSLSFAGVQKVSADGSLLLKLKPSKITLESGESFSIELQLRNSTHMPVNESLININYDSTRVEYVGFSLNKSIKSSAVDIGAGPNVWLKNRNTVTLWIKEELDLFSVDTDLTIVTLNFKIKNGVDSGVVFFNLAGGNVVGQAFNGTDFDGTVINIGPSNPADELEESSDNDLVALGVTYTNIVFAGVNSYIANVGNEVSKVEIFAVASSSSATVIGTGIKELEVGKNEFDVVVTAEDGSEQTYSLVINRADTESEESKESIDSILAIVFGVIALLLAIAVAILYLRMKKILANTI